MNANISTALKAYNADEIYFYQLEAVVLEEVKGMEKEEAISTLKSVLKLSHKNAHATYDSIVPAAPAPSSKSSTARRTGLILASLATHKEGVSYGKTWILSQDRWDDDFSFYPIDWIGQEVCYTYA